MHYNCLYCRYHRVYACVPMSCSGQWVETRLWPNIIQHQGQLGGLPTGNSTFLTCDPCDVWVHGPNSDQTWYQVSQNKLCHVTWSKPNMAQYILGHPVEIKWFYFIQDDVKRNDFKRSPSYNVSFIHHESTYLLLERYELRFHIQKLYTWIYLRHCQE